MEIKRGYVKWTDENGFHKELASEHPDLLAKASVKEQIQAEEARRMHEAAEEAEFSAEVESEETSVEVLEALKDAPAEVLTVSEVESDAPLAGAEEA